MYNVHGSTRAGCCWRYVHAPVLALLNYLAPKHDMGVSRNPEPPYRPQVVGLSVQGHLQKGPLTCRSSHMHNLGAAPPAEVRIRGGSLNSDASLHGDGVRDAEPARARTSFEVPPDGLGPCLKVLGDCFPYFWGPGRNHSYHVVALTDPCACRESTRSTVLHPFWDACRKPLT